MEQNVGRLISILSRKHMVYLNHTLKPFNLTSSEHPILMYLYHYENATQEQICQYLNIDKGALARNIQSLIEKGYVVKKKSDKDKRCFIVSLTEKAWFIQEDIKKRLHYWSDFLTQGLDEKNKDLLLETLEGMVKKIDSVDQEEWRNFFGKQ